MEWATSEHKKNTAATAVAVLLATTTRAIESECRLPSDQTMHKHLRFHICSLRNVA